MGKEPPSDEPDGSNSSESRRDDTDSSESRMDDTDSSESRMDELGSSDSRSADFDAATDDDSGSANVARRLAIAFALAIGSQVVSVVFSLPFVFPPITFGKLVVAIIVAEIAFAAVAVLFVLVSGRGLSYFSFSWSTRSAVTLVAVGTVVLFLVRSLVLVASVFLGIEPATPGITQVDESQVARLLLILVPVSILVIGPAEELLFRGVILQYLSKPLSNRRANLATSVLFALWHVPSLVSVSAVGVLTTLVVLVVVSYGLGLLYYRSESVLVPALVHGFYNALIVGTAYVAITYGNVPL